MPAWPVWWTGRPSSIGRGTSGPCPTGAILPRSCRQRRTASPSRSGRSSPAASRSGSRRTRSWACSSRSARSWTFPLFSCRGYTSQSEVWGAAQRLERYLVAGQEVVILHFGDHDPSGLDLTRDIRERLRLFLLHDRIRHEDGRHAFASDEVRREWLVPEH